jgi:hypothetical protein
MQTGILVTPHISNDQRAGIDIQIRQFQPSTDHSNSIQTGHLRTHIQAKLGEWIDIGGILSNMSVSRTGWVQGASDRTSSQTRIFVRLDLVP